MPNYWLIIHDPISFQEHNNLIGCRTKPGSKEPKHRMFGSIASGDLIVYYATVINAVVGTFEVIAGPEYRENDEYWGSSVVYKIVPRSQPVNGFYLDFKKFVTESGAKLSPFPDKKIWFRYIQGKVIRTLTSTDFELITSQLTNRRFLSPIKDFKIQPSRWRKRQMAPKVTELIQGSPHQQLKEMAEMLGKICGFDTASEVPLHLVNPEVPKEVANRTVDVVWKLGKYLTIPIEIQVHGSPTQQFED